MATLFRNTVVYVLVGFLPVAANFLLAPIYTKYLKPEEYALVGISTLFQTFLTFFISFSLDGAFSRLFFKYERRPALKHALLSTLLISVIALGIVVTLVISLAGERFFSFFFANPAFTFARFGSWVVLTTFCNVIFLFFAILYRNEEKLKRFVIVSLSFFFLPVIGALIGLRFVEDAPWGTVVGKAVGSAIIAGFVLGRYFWGKALVVAPRLFREAVRYSLPLVPYQLMFAAFANIDRIIIEQKFYARDFGIYNFAVMVSGLIPIFINSISNAVNPRIYRELTKDKDPASVRTFNQVSLLSTTVIICLCVAAVVPAMRLFISTDYADAYLYVGTLFLSYLPYIHYLIYTVPLFYHGKTKPFPVISFVALMAGIGFNYAFLSTLGIWSVCLSLYVIRITQMTISYMYVRKHDFHVLDFLRQQRAMLVSFIIIILYNVSLFLNLYFQFVPVDLVNVIPLATFVILAAWVYKKEIVLLYSYLIQFRKSITSSKKPLNY